ncbi:MAG: hypothetical protein OET44_11680 [Gammaproteobacteria bacterium]|nr:hypothetical protein [Gammaproteobacteria bacterium]
MLERYSRLQVFSVHLGISLLIFTALAIAMVSHWFPGPFFATDGGWQGMRIIAAVDLVLGPSLTLIFFAPKRKKHRALLFDLVSIATVQVIALGWGTWTVYNQRTVAIAFSGHQFYSISYGALTDANATLRADGKHPQDIFALSDTHPRRVFVKPLEKHEAGQFLADIFNGLPDLQLRSDRYLELAPHWDEIAEHALQMREFAKESPDLAADVAELEDRLDELEFYRLKMRFGTAVAGFEIESRELAYIFPYERPVSSNRQDQETENTDSGDAGKEGGTEKETTKEN